jgi:hypothetical protein
MFSFSSPTVNNLEIDVYFEDAKKEASCFESHLTAIGRVNERFAIVKGGLKTNCRIVKERC